MVYIAKENIDKYNKGDIVPDEIAIVWKQMYLVSPVELKEERQLKRGLN
jgi:hypothetical protein